MCILIFERERAGALNVSFLSAIVASDRSGECVGGDGVRKWTGSDGRRKAGGWIEGCWVGASH